MAKVKSRARLTNPADAKIPFPPAGCKARYCWMGNGWKTQAMRRAKGN